MLLGLKVVCGEEQNFNLDQLTYSFKKFEAKLPLIV